MEILARGEGGGGVVFIVMMLKFSVLNFSVTIK